MQADERCSKNPSIPKAYCSHCQGLERGSAANPKFSIKEGHWGGYPMVEVLSNGGPIHEFDEHFRFGVRKAHLLLSCLPVLSRFWHATDEGRLVFEGQVIKANRFIRTLICVVPHKNFRHSSGAIIDHTYLELEEAYPNEEDRVRLGVGALKCRAICEVQEDLRRWLSRLGELKANS